MPERSSNGKKSKAPATLDLMGDVATEAPPMEAHRAAPKATPAPPIQEDEHGALFGGEDVDLSARHPADVPVGGFPAPSEIAERDDAPEPGSDPFAEDDPFADTPMARMLADVPPPLSAGMRAARESLVFADAPAPVVAELVVAVEDVTEAPEVEQKEDLMAAAPSPAKEPAARREVRRPRPDDHAPLHPAGPERLGHLRVGTAHRQHRRQRRHRRLRAARRRDPQGLVPARHQRRRLQVLPGPRRHPGAGVQRQAAHRSRRRPHLGMGQGGRLLRHRRGRRGLPRRAALYPPAPDGRLQLPRLVQPRLAGKEASRFRRVI